MPLTRPGPLIIIDNFMNLTSCRKARLVDFSNGYEGAHGIQRVPIIIPKRGTSVIPKYRLTMSPNVAPTLQDVPPAPACAIFFLHFPKGPSMKCMGIYPLGPDVGLPLMIFHASFETKARFLIMREFIPRPPWDFGRHTSFQLTQTLPLMWSLLAQRNMLMMLSVSSMTLRGRRKTEDQLNWRLKTNWIALPRLSYTDDT
jgi:hypothetical protein